MRRYGSSKQNPNPPWPNEQKTVVVPPGSSSGAIGITAEIEETQNAYISEYIHSRDEENPIMDYTNFENTMLLSNGIKGSICSKMSVSDYLCKKTGKYAKVEFMFGENTHIEKTGVLESVGRDFIVLSEAGSGARVVCSVKNIKFINIYNVG